MTQIQYKQTDVAAITVGPGDIESAASYFDWSGQLSIPGRSGQRQIGLGVVLRALVVILKHARALHAEEFGLSVRQLRVLGFRGGKDEASLALRALPQLGFLEKLGRRQPDSTRYRLALPLKDPLPRLDTPIQLPEVRERSAAELTRLGAQHAADRKKYDELVQRQRRERGAKTSTPG